MNILFITVVDIESVSQRGVYTDLIRELRDRGENVYIVCPRERHYGKPTEYIEDHGINVLKVRTGNIQKTNPIEKGISTILIQSQFINAIKKYFKDIHFDLVLYSTPPITFEKVVRFVKVRDECHTYLLLKDIFPQNAVDLGIIKKGSLLWRYFRNKEKQLYEISDFIGCMSKANVEYLLKHNPQVNPRKVEVSPNCIKPRPLPHINEPNKELRYKYGIPDDAVVFIYGGNLGKPQGINFLLNVLDRIKDKEGIFFLIVGSGTEYSRIKTYLNQNKHKNVKLLNFLPKDNYDEILESSGVGLIFLDHRFTIPNFPSRLTSYMEAALPVAAATDVNTDLKDVLIESGCGLWAESRDVEGFINIIERLASDKNLRIQMGLNGWAYLEKNYTVSKQYDIIMSHFK